MSRRLRKKEVEEVRAKDIRNVQSDSRTRWLVFSVCVYLAGITWFVFGQTLGHQFVNLDDSVYVYENPHITAGLTRRGIAWVFTHVVTTYAVPLTMLSHMLDCQLYGLAPGGHHLTNVLLHMAAAILLFLVLRQMTGALWPGAFVAAVFAIHPLRVESVAWVTERKDVLSGLFFMLTLGAYVRYARKPWALGRYLAVVILFALGLLAKPMLVSLPLVLLLLDYWPLGRWTKLGLGRLIVEKTPLLLLSAATCMVTAFGGGRALGNAQVVIPPPLRIGNAAVSCVTYLGQMFYPAGLALLYPFPATGQPLWKATLSIFLLVLLSAGAFLFRKKRPYLLVGWLWYLGMLMPVIGIVATLGREAHADRYTYLPQIGIYLLVTWAAVELSASWPHRREILGVTAVGAIAALAVCARVQTAYWRDSESLWTRTLACTSANAFAQVGLGLALLEKGRVEDAVGHYKAALEINPNDTDAHKNLGGILLSQGKAAEAVVHFRKALETKADIPEAQLNLGYALLENGQAQEANAHFARAFEINSDDAEGHIAVGSALLRKERTADALAHFQKALEIEPDNVDAHLAAGAALLATKRTDEAILHFRRALEIKPRSAEACYNLGNALLGQGRPGEAVVYFQRALEINPEYVEACTNLAHVLAASGDVSVRDGARAVELAGQANRLSGGNDPTVLGTLAAAYAEAGRFREAVETGRRAAGLASDRGQTALAELLRRQLERYEAGAPWRDTPRL